MPIKRLLCVLFLSWTVALVCFGQNDPKPDLLLFHANVITMNPANPTAQAIAVTGDRIAWMGSDTEAQKLFRSARKVDLHGATVLPGIIDAHTHMFELGKSLLRLNLKDVAT
jgi:predicted amidohydrolase YtcJ